MSSAKTTNIQVINRAEEEIRRYEDNDLLWLKHICNFHARPQQLMYMAQMDEHPFMSIVATQRSGKSRGIVAKLLKWCACNPSEDLRFFAPAVYQARKNLKDMEDLILQSPILLAYIEDRLGRRQLSATGFSFVNKSNAEAFGQDSNLDGVNATIIYPDEFDDMNYDIFKNRILPRGMGVNENGMPTRVIVSGTIQEARGNLYTIEQDASYFKTPKINIYHALKAGIIDRDMFNLLKENLTADEWVRIALCKFMGGRTFFPNNKLRQMQLRGGEFGLHVVEPEPGRVYAGEGELSFGLDMGAQGQKAHASKYSLTVEARVGEYKHWVYCREWPATVDPKIIKRDVVDLWGYFRPKGGLGDAFDSNLMAEINDMLYAEGLVSYSRHREGTEENKPANWDKWPLQPIRFTGYTEHWMYKTLRDDIYQGRFFTPATAAEEDERFDPSKARDFVNPAQGAKALVKFIIQCKNIRAERAPSGQYLLFEMIKPKLGDDNVASCAMANAYLETGKGSTGGPIEHVSSGEQLTTLSSRAGVFNT